MLCVPTPTSLARWHQATRSLTGIEQATPWLMARVNGERQEQPFLQRSDLQRLVNHILADDALRPSLDHVKHSWQSTHLVHGDLRLTNVMFHGNGSVRLIDWDSSGWGDPRWDLGGLLQELQSLEIQHGVDTSAHRATFLSAYAERAVGPSPLTEDDPTLRAFVAGRLVLRAIQLTCCAGGSDDVVDAHLHLARALRSP